ncbi:MAG TPA: hypothetical protein PJ991_04825 [Kiritimatiellia bacterium]|nr:hypothetical protein [Kiritimatiellia bacterium]
MPAHRLVAICLLAIASVTAGCAGAKLNSARSDYFSGAYLQAAQRLEDQSFPKRDRVLFLMERGMIRQAAGDFEGSTRDFIAAYNTIESMTAISLTQDSASMIINDSVQEYRGAPFERTLLHSFTAKNHLLQSNWELAAVEARRIIQSLAPESLRDYPEDAYSRYMAGLCLSLIGDWSNAALQYRLAARLTPHLSIHEQTGHISLSTNSTTDATVPANIPGDHELIVLVLIGRSPTGHELEHSRRPIRPAGYAEIIVNGGPAGRSYALADTMDLAFTTKQKDAIRDMAKTVSRIALKEVTARSLEKEDELLGLLFRLIMINMLEQPDIRRWETLPRSLQVARMPVPANLESVQVNFKTSSGAIVRSVPVSLPLPQNQRTFITVVRDTQPIL